MKPASTTPASGAPDAIDTQINRLIEEYKKNHMRVDVLQQFIALGMANGRHDMVERHLYSLLEHLEQKEFLYLVIASIQKKRGDYLKAAETIRALFDGKGTKTEAMYDTAALILPRTEQLADLELCCRLLEEGMKQYPFNATIIHHLTEIYQLLKQHEKAVSLYKSAIARMPDNETFFFGLGLAEMIGSNLTKGFDAYKHRFQLPDFKKRIPSPLLWPEWQGENLQNKKLYLWSEQGVGDILMWSTMLPWLAQQAAGITCAVPAKMLPLFSRSFPAINFIEKLQQAIPADFDYHCPMGNLTEYVLPNYKPSQHPACLKADKDAVARKRKEYFAHNPKARKLIGLSWHTTASAGWRRNIPLALWHPFLKDPEAVYVSLQYNQQLDDVACFDQQSVRPMLTDYSFIPVVDFDMWATQHAAMDHIFSIQNSSAHLAGALGIPTTLFLSAHSSLHWGNGSTPNCWYESVTVYRRKPGQKWESLIEESMTSQR